MNNGNESDSDDSDISVVGSYVVSIPLRKSSGGPATVEIDPEEDEDIETVITLLKEEKCKPSVWVDVVKAYHMAANNGESREKRRKCEERLLDAFLNETEWEETSYVEDRALMMTFKVAFKTEEYARLDVMLSKADREKHYGDA